MKMNDCCPRTMKKLRYRDEDNYEDRYCDLCKRGQEAHMISNSQELFLG